MTRNFLILTIAFWATCAWAQGQAISDQTAKALVAAAQTHFWGFARDSTGAVIALPEGRDSSAPIIPDDQAVRVVNAAHPVGLAMACDVEWQPFYLAFMANERGRHIWSETQVAFIGLLFGVAQQHVFEAAQGSCTTERKRQVEQALTNDDDA